MVPPVWQKYGCDSEQTSAKLHTQGGEWGRMLACIAGLCRIGFFTIEYFRRAAHRHDGGWLERPGNELAHGIINLNAERHGRRTGPLKGFARNKSTNQTPIKSFRKGSTLRIDGSLYECQGLDAVQVEREFEKRYRDSIMRQEPFANRVIPPRSARKARAGFSKLFWKSPTSGDQ